MTVKATVLGQKELKVSSPYVSFGFLCVTKSKVSLRGIVRTELRFKFSFVLPLAFVSSGLSYNRQGIQNHFLELGTVTLPNCAFKFTLHTFIILTLCFHAILCSRIFSGLKLFKHLNLVFEEFQHLVQFTFPILPFIWHLYESSHPE